MHFLHTRHAQIYVAANTRDSGINCSVDNNHSAEHFSSHAMLSWFNKTKTKMQITSGIAWFAVFALEFDFY